MQQVELDPGALIRTAERLSDRIAARFPDSSLRARSGDLVYLARHARTRCEELRRPVWAIRALYVLLFVLVAIGLYAATRLELDLSNRDAVGWLEGVEAAANDLLLLGAGMAFLFTLENRIKRRRALRELHALRSFAHVIDMLQLTKDPQRIVGNVGGTAASPKAELTAYELGRYLDYCSESLSLASKIAALYVQHFDDPVALASVNEIEILTTGLSRKIWQKLMILMTTHPEAAPTAAP